MSAPDRRARRQRLARAVRALEERGICWARWAEDRGFSREAVRHVRAGRGPALRGEAARIAEAILWRAEANRMRAAIESCDGEQVLDGAREQWIGEAELLPLLRLACAAIDSILCEWEAGADEDWIACEQLLLALDERNWPGVEAALQAVARGAGDYLPARIQALRDIAESRGTVAERQRSRAARVASAGRAAAEAGEEGKESSDA